MGGLFTGQNIFKKSPRRYRERRTHTSVDIRARPFLRALPQFVDLPHRQDVIVREAAFIAVHAVADVVEVAWGRSLCR